MIWKGVTLILNYGYFRLSWMKNRIDAIYKATKDRPRKYGKLKIVVSANRTSQIMVGRLEKELGLKTPILVEEKDFREVSEAFVKFLAKKLLEGNDIRLFSNLGIIGVRGKKTKAYIDADGNVRGVAPSWSKTKRNWEAIAASRGITLQEYINSTTKEERKTAYCYNEHSGGIQYNLKWAKANSLATNKEYYGLVFTRGNRRELNRRVVEEGAEYLVLGRRDRMNIKRKRIKVKTDNNEN